MPKPMPTHGRRGSAQFVSHKDALRYAEELAQEREAPLKERIAELEVKLQKWMGNASMAGCELLRQTWSIRETGIGSTAKEDSHG